MCALFCYFKCTAVKLKIQKLQKGSGVHTWKEVSRKRAGSGSRVCRERFILRKEGDFSDKDTLGEDRDVRRRREGM